MGPSYAGMGGMGTYFHTRTKLHCALSAVPIKMTVLQYSVLSKVRMLVRFDAQPPDTSANKRTHHF